MLKGYTFIGSILIGGAVSIIMKDREFLDIIAATIILALVFHLFYFAAKDDRR